MAKERGMATGPAERSKALHNFTMPCDLRWGNQRHLRCMRVNSDGRISPVHGFTGKKEERKRNQGLIQQRRTVRDLEGQFSGGFVGPTSRGGGGEEEDEGEDDGIAAMREKVMLDLQTAANKMKDAILKEGGGFSVSPSVPPPPPPTTDRPWNLRARRAACKMPIIAAGRNGCSSAVGGFTDGKVFRFDAARPNTGFSQIRSSATPAAATTQKSTIHRIDTRHTAAASDENNQRPKFSVALSKREIEEDFFAMVGHRPPRRPKKRTRTVQKDLDSLFPGLWLTEITPDMYKVPEFAAP